MMDTCRVLSYSSSPDLWGQPQPTYTPGPAIPCGYEPVGGVGQKEIRLDEKTLATITATLRLPITTAITQRDRIEITHRHGEALSPTVTLEVIGSIRRGPSGLLIDVNRVSL